MRSIRPALILVASAALVFAGVMLTGKLRAQQPGPSPTPYYVITFVDLMPANTDAGVSLLKQHVDTTRKAHGIQRVEALSQMGRPNHVVLYEVWQNEDAFNKHEDDAATRDFRAKMQPLLGAPFDQRPHSKLE